MSNHALVMKTEKLSQCSKIWKDIFQQSQNPSPFSSYEWFYALCNSLLKKDPEVMIFIEEDKPAGILPAIIENNTLKLIGDERVTDLNDIICLPNYEKRVIEEFASFVQNRNIKINLCPLPTNSPLVRFLPEHIGGLIIEHADVCPILYLPSSWEKYLANLNGKLRHELKRKLKRAIDVEIITQKPDHIEILFHLMSISDNNKKEFLKSDICTFFKVIANSFSKNNWLRFHITCINNQPIAAIFSFYLNDKIYLYNTGFDPNFYHLSPGIITIGLDIKSAIKNGFKFYDFLRGDEEYKFHLGAEKRYSMRIKK
jgi:hypothetical protein